MNARLPERKRPLHMPPVEHDDRPVILFVSFGVQPRVPVLANRRFADVFVRACADADAWRVGRYMIMPDHIHLFCAPATSPMVGIKPWIRYLKERITKRWKAALAEDLEGERLTAGSPSSGMSGHLEGEAAPSRGRASGSPQVRPPGGISGHLEGEAVPSRPLWKWQSDCWDTQLRNGEQYCEKWEYVRQNPVRERLVATAGEWPWQGELNVLVW